MLTPPHWRRAHAEQGWISGGYNVINGHVKGPGRSEVGELTGHWHSTMDFADRKTGKKTTLFDASKARNTPKTVIPESEQEENESRRFVLQRLYGR